MNELIARVARRIFRHDVPKTVTAPKNPLEGMIPDASIARYVGANTADFRFVGEYNVARMRELAQLQANERVLDVGCGIGRIAVSLTQYLNPRGSYLGFDIVKAGIDWCQQRITPRYPNFRFVVADIHNDLYNPAGTQKAVDYRFPLDDRSVDFVFLTSVFTHMPRAEVEHYIEEMYRVLDHGGRVFCTAFVITNERRAKIDTGQSGRTFFDTGEGYWIERSDNPMNAVAFEEAKAREMFEARGLELVCFVPDDWTTNPWAQDTLVFRKP